MKHRRPAELIAVFVVISLQNRGVSFSLAPTVGRRGRRIETKSRNTRHGCGRCSPVNFALKEPENSQFGRQAYWNDFYAKEANFSWYAGWEELGPFIREFVGPDHHVLLPGVGNDAMLADMYQDGYVRLTAMDYAPEGILRCREMLGDENVASPTNANGVNLVVADARDLSEVFENETFDAVIEKGTLDAIYLSGGRNKTLASENLNLAISELGRSLKPGGIWISLAAVVDDEIQKSFDSVEASWLSLVRQGDLFVTQDGYTSNNVDGSLLIWRKPLL